MGTRILFLSIVSLCIHVHLHSTAAWHGVFMGGTFRGMTLKKMAAGDQDLDGKKRSLELHV